MNRDRKLISSIAIASLMLILLISFLFIPIEDIDPPYVPDEGSITFTNTYYELNITHKISYEHEDSDWLDKYTDAPLSRYFLNITFDLWVRNDTVNVTEIGLTSDLYLLVNTTFAIEDVNNKYYNAWDENITDELVNIKNLSINVENLTGGYQISGVYKEVWMDLWNLEDTNYRLNYTFFSAYYFSMQINDSGDIQWTGEDTDMYWLPFSFEIKYNTVILIPLSWYVITISMSIFLIIVLIARYGKKKKNEKSNISAGMFSSKLGDKAKYQ